MMCTHYEGRTCKAYPDGIPQVIRTGEVLHLNKLQGQSDDFVFKPKNASDPFTQSILESSDLIEKREEIEQEISKLTVEIIHETMTALDWKQSILEVNRNPKWMMESQFEELHVVRNDRKIVSGEIPKSSRFCKLHQQLLTIGNIENQFTTLRTIVFPNGKCKFEFTKERSNYLRMKEEVVERELEEVRLCKNHNLVRLTHEEAAQKVKNIIENENPNQPISDALIGLILEMKGFVLLRTEIKKIRDTYSIPYFIQRKGKIS